MVVLVDGNNMLYCQTAAAKLNSKGRPTQGIVGVMKELRAILDRYHPDSLMVVWDGSRSRKRMEIFPEYKGNRDDKTPQEQALFEEFLYQKPIVRQAVLDLGLCSIEGPSVEADDVIAIFTDAFVESGQEVVIVSSDKDFFQLLGPHVRVFKPTQKEPREITVEALKDMWGVIPGQWLDLRAVVGDKSDNIDGVKGVAEKTMAVILKKYGSLSEFWLKGTPSGKREMLLAEPMAKSIVARNRILMDLRNPCLHQEDRESVDIARGQIDIASLETMLREYEIHSIFLALPMWIKPFQSLCGGNHGQKAA